MKIKSPHCNIINKQYSREYSNEFDKIVLCASRHFRAVISACVKDASQNRRQKTMSRWREWEASKAVSTMKQFQAIKVSNLDCFLNYCAIFDVNILDHRHKTVALSEMSRTQRTTHSVSWLLGPGTGRFLDQFQLSRAQPPFAVHIARVSYVQHLACDRECGEWDQFFTYFVKYVTNL